LVDAIRIGRARERRVAERELFKRLKVHVAARSQKAGGRS
jgi:hypothetical protein